MSYTVPPLVPCPTAVLVVVDPGAPAAATGPTMHDVELPTTSGSVNVHDAVLTSGSVTEIAPRSSTPVLTRTNRYQTSVPAATVIADDHGPPAAVPICFSSEKPGTAPRYSAVDGAES